MELDSDKYFLKAENLELKFENRIIIENLNFKIKEGEKVVITGNSGTGKSSLLNLIAGFIPFFSGKVFINDLILNEQNVFEIRKLLSWVPQDSALNFYTCNELFFAPFEFAINKNFKPEKTEIEEIFETFNLGYEILKKNVSEISGGQRQRLITASAILLKKPLLILDEPTSALDENSKKKVTDRILSENSTVIASTHDEYWKSKADKLINLNN